MPAPEPPEDDFNLGESGDRRQEPWTRDRITQVLQTSIADRKWLRSQIQWMRRRVHTMEWVVGVMAVTLILTAIGITGLPGTGFRGLIGENSKRADEAATTAKELATLVAQIQADRRRNIRNNCKDQNARHDNTLAQLSTLVEALPEGPRKERARASIGGTVALIEALVPKRRCGQLVREQVTAPAEDRP